MRSNSYINSGADVPRCPSCSKASIVSTSEYDLVFFAILRYFAGFDFGFEKLEDIDYAMIVETAFGVVEFGEGG